MTKKMNNKQLEKIEKLKSFLVDSGQVSKFSLDFGERKSNRILQEVSGVVQNDLYIHDCGLDRWDSLERKTTQGKNIFNSLHYVVKGEGVLECEGTEYKISKGCIFVVFADVESVYRPDPKNPWTYIYLDMGGILQSSVIRRLGFDTKHCVKKYKDVGNLEKRFYEVYESTIETDPRSFQTMSALYGLCAELEELESEGGHWNHQERYVRQALTYIKNNLAHVTVEAIAEECAVSTAYLTRICKQVLGFSLKELITVTRMQAASNRLKYTHQPIKRIREICGYSETKYFSRLFKAIFGVTPTEYRNREQSL